MHRRFLAARAAYVAVVLLATLSQLHFSPNLADASMRLHRAFVPSLAWSDAIDGLRNAVLFAGLGVVWVTTSFVGDIPREIRLATLTSFLLSATVEGCQVFSPVRTASLVDVTTNTLGGFGGAVATAILFVALRDARSRQSCLGVPMLLIAGPYATATLCEALAPLFQSAPIQTLSGGPVGHLVGALRLSSFDWTLSDAFDVPLYLAGGFVIMALARERHRAKSSPWPVIAAVGALLTVVAHIAHGVVNLPIRWIEIVLDAASVVVGVWAADRWFASLTQRLRGAARARAFIFAYGALLVVWAWRPFVPETRLKAVAAELDASAFIPLAGLGMRFDAFSASHVAQQFLLYVPLGAVLAVWPVRISGTWSGFWPAVLLAIVVEVGHIIVADRTFDVTNTLLACAGLAAAWTAVRRSGYRPYGQSG